MDTFLILCVLENWIAANIEKVQGGYFCHPCGKTFKSNLFRHVRDAHLEKDLCYVCPTCNAISKNKNSFQFHITTKHPEMKGIDLNQFARQKQ